MGLGKLTRDCAGPTSHIFKDLSISLLVLQHRISYEVFGPTVSEFANINRLQGTGQKLQELIRESQVETTQSIFNRFPASQSPKSADPSAGIYEVSEGCTHPPNRAAAALQPAAAEQPCRLRLAACSLAALQLQPAAPSAGVGGIGRRPGHCKRKSKMQRNSKTRKLQQKNA